LSKAHARAKAYMESTIWFTDGFVVITGEIGSGKTTLIETFLRELEKDVVVAQINQTQISAIEFLQSVLVQFGFTPFRMKKAELLATLNNFLVEQYGSNRKVLLIVDEAQNLSERALEEIRLLSGVETTKEKVLRIILAGQPELNAKLDAPELVQLTQRIRLRFHLGALSAEDMKSYILHRLEVAGSQGREIFPADSFSLIYRYTGGVPRLINTLCDTAMLAAFNADSDVVRLDDIREALEELQWSEFAARAGSTPAPLAGVETSRAQSAEPGAPAAAGPVLARLVVATSGQTITELELRRGRLIIGRTSGNDLQIDSRFVSRHHCQILTSEKYCVMEDLNSTNGVFIKSKRIRHHNLNDGDVVTIGQHELLYIDERPTHRSHSGQTDTGDQPAPEHFSATAVVDS
jgi:type II secretory pathway predicted ATPase ExeA